MVTGPLDGPDQLAWRKLVNTKVFRQSGAQDTGGEHGPRGIIGESAELLGFARVRLGAVAERADPPEQGGGCR
ncbi:hypothetical protein AOZ06_16480 [Kibdelosporangium phytohabitans]|uniref:Uncharacterized protein n=1 Tax=Kibdelosporangium phytohabitans TaxID=860235 RepID=A0A0N9HXQ5_9PSEU|nr:hypothetical protein AOZ06_16480 [Kibdelosporangium phytohabitans]